MGENELRDMRNTVDDVVKTPLEPSDEIDASVDDVVVKSPSEPSEDSDELKATILKDLEASDI